MPQKTTTQPDRRRGSAALDWADRYLAALEKGNGTYGRAAKAAKVSMSTVFRRRKSDLQFAEREREALEHLSDILSDEVFRRAVEGVKIIKKTAYGDQVETRYSDALLLRILERHDPTWRRGYAGDLRQKQPKLPQTLAERRANVERHEREERAKAEAQTCS